MKGKIPKNGDVLFLYKMMMEKLKDFLSSLEKKPSILINTKNDKFSLSCKSSEASKESTPIYTFDVGVNIDGRTFRQNSCTGYKTNYEDLWGNALARLEKHLSETITDKKEGGKLKGIEPGFREFYKKFCKPSVAGL